MFANLPPPDPRFVLEPFEPAYVATRRRGEVAAAYVAARAAGLWRFDTRGA